MNVAVLGLTFKPGTDDLREAPSIDNIELLLDAGVNVKAYDPISIESFKKKISYKFDDDGTTGTRNTDAVLIMTEWPEIKDYSIDKYKKLMKTPRVYDGRNCYNLDDTKDIIYKSIGR